MATLTPTRPGSGGLVPDPPRIVRISPADRPAAVARLMGVDTQDRESIGTFIAQAGALGTDLNNLWAAVRIPGRMAGLEAGGAGGGCGSGGGGGADRLPPGTVVAQSCLAMINPGRTAVLLVSPGLPEGAVGTGEYARARVERAAVIDAACRGLSQADEGGGPPRVVLGQALLETDETEMIASFEGAGFFRLADLAYMRRAVPRGAEARRSVRIPAGIEVVTLQEAGPAGAGDELLKTALARSYEQTLDCPALCGLRALDDVLESHRAVGSYDPSLWFLAMEGGRPEGCMLLSAGASEDTVELVYLGLAPAVRGKGLGGALLAHGLASLVGRRESTLACAVDMQNAPALRLYRRSGFRRFATRVAMVRSLAGGASC